MLSKIRNFWWAARYHTLNVAWLVTGRPRLFYLRFYYHPYPCAVRRMVKRAEKARESWLACRWCNSPRTVKPDSMDGRCDRCISEAHETPKAIAEQVRHEEWVRMQKMRTNEN